jgi:hypothetical protein
VAEGVAGVAAEGEGMDAAEAMGGDEVMGGDAGEAGLSVIASAGCGDGSAVDRRAGAEVAR